MEILVADMERDVSHCVTALLPQLEKGDDESAPTRSRLQLFEDGKRLERAHSLHDDIRNRGAGRFSHWGDKLYFSSSDHSDPLTSGRKYVATGPGRQGYIPHKSVLRGHEVVPAFMGGPLLAQDLIEEMERHPEAAGRSSWGTRNVLQAFVLSMRPAVVLEIGAHIGLATVLIGAALKANGSGTLFSLEPQDHYFGC